MSEENKAVQPPGNGQTGRRRWLGAAVALAAATTGGVLSWRKFQSEVPPTAQELALWQMEFPTPAGPVLQVKALRGKPVLLNFWATWCPPCIDELPLLSSFFQENSSKGWQVVGLAVDQLAPVQRFLAQSPVSFPVALAGNVGIELGRSLGNVSGGLPFTVVLGSDGRVVHRKMGRVSPSDLQAWVLLK